MKSAPQPQGLPRPLLNRGRPLIFGVLNVTPDSFSDGGRYVGPQAAIAAGRQMIASGADVVDVGGESTRPGAVRIPVEEELERVLPVISALAAHGVPVSIDTMRAAVARSAVDAGAVLVNDVSGGQADPAMLGTIASLDVPYVVMHWRGHSNEMDALADYGDVGEQVRAEVLARVDACTEAGIDRRRLIIDPGIGFAKTADHNWQLLKELPMLVELGLPVLLGASRKRFLGALLAANETPREVLDREAATIAVSALATMNGVWAVRVHEVRGNADAVRVAVAWANGG